MKSVKTNLGPGTSFTEVRQKRLHPGDSLDGDEQGRAEVELRRGFQTGRWSMTELRGCYGVQFQFCNLDWCYPLTIAPYSRCLLGL